MEFRQLGSSDLTVSTVALGTWVTGGWWWGGSKEKESVAAIEKAIDLGVNLIDTAPVYGFGRSEKIVGKAIREKRDKVLIATKCGLRWHGEDGKFHFESADQDGKLRRVYRNLRPASIRHECERSLKRLGVDVIDLYQCHWPDPTTPEVETMEALLRLKEEGKIRAIGVSNFTAAMMARCQSVTALASDQPKYSMLDRAAEKGVLPFTRKHGIGVISYSPLEQGILTGAVTLDRTFPKSDGRPERPWFQKDNLTRALTFLEKLRPMAEDRGATLAQLAIGWMIAQSGVTSAIVGGRTAEQVAENVGGAQVTLSEDELATIRGWLDELGRPK